jgi:HSP20 family protein
MLALWNQFDDLFNDDHFKTRRLARSFVPAVDIEETREGYLLIADLPGLTAEDVNITVENGVLVLSGERKDERVDEKDGYKRIERSFGSFRRSFTLPKGVNAEQVTAKTEHGQVKVSIPKPVAELPRKIKIESAGPVVS